MKRSGWWPWLALLWPMLALAGADPQAQQLLDCMRGNVPDSLRVQDIVLTATDRGGADRTLRGRIFGINDHGLVRAMIRIDAPPDLSGAAYLMREMPDDHDNQIFFYLPAVDRVRRIAGASAQASLLGTDFSYSDMKDLQSAFADSEAGIERNDHIGARAVAVLSLRPKPGTGSRYSGIHAWVDRQTCVALKVDFEQAGVLRKTFTADPSALTRSGRYWYLSEAQMRDLKEGTHTVLKVVGVTGGEALPTGLFDPHSFYLGN